MFEPLGILPGVILELLGMHIVGLKACRTLAGFFWSHLGIPGPVMVLQRMLNGIHSRSIVLLESRVPGGGPWEPKSILRVR